MLLLGGLAALTYWLDAQVQADTARRDGSTRHDPDMYIEGFRAVSFDADGRVRQSLSRASAPSTIPDDDSVDFTAPTLALTDPGRPRMSVTADAGTLSGDRETRHVPRQRARDARRAARRRAGERRAARDRSR